MGHQKKTAAMWRKEIQDLLESLGKNSEQRIRDDYRKYNMVLTGPVKSGTNAYVAYLRPKFRLLSLFSEDSSSRALLAVVSKMPAA